ncbi:MAG: hypothetical protein BWY87_00679 [Deltaproteobacteria bacterium ADurb.Bin510]|nr:MAG: hypothetical protein BWY87_00679 [Deltaproteobacteria bacterium ADurb.Bin510]
MRSLLGAAPATLYDLAARAYPQGLKRDPFLSMMKTAVYLEELADEIVAAEGGYALKPR